MSDNIQSEKKLREYFTVKMWYDTDPDTSLKIKKGCTLPWEREDSQQAIETSAKKNLKFSCRDADVFL